MIGRLTGEVADKQPPRLLLDVHGVGYELEASMNTFYKLPAIGERVTLHTHMVVREDAQLLYAFIDAKERVLFRALIKTNGVGPKLALAILSGTSCDEFIRCVHNEDSATLVRIPGVGKKTAERLIVEMKDKLDRLELPTMTEFQLDSPGGASRVAVADNRAEAESALVALGYKPVQATRAVEQAASELGEGAVVEELIRLSLKSMVSG
ncbi:Holliday junction DNA helicase RuvA [Marinobacterium lacunae]|uniref:Holliday junction branch migration complex subunit RuvA n=1 Tax=Marinobacterium lacunae TaxID=1232683 RepID=A0A081FU57_9GAMM|nr:Holliday junction branch migration protein RuvA [Marinobacterium lacunae]KEA62062.1 Holliday junction DNA helicase RuvA [Marinobacterium lacunae]MBR9883025.1 Holliday junction branch migration protein RuvA [Oceanospirillales bacterium]